MIKTKCLTESWLSHCHKFSPTRSIYDIMTVSYSCDSTFLLSWGLIQCTQAISPFLLTLTTSGKLHKQAANLANTSTGFYYEVEPRPASHHIDSSTHINVSSISLYCCIISNCINMHIVTPHSHKDKGIVL